jgi:hypothetical protein
MDDLELLRRHRPDVAPPDPAASRRAEQSLMALIEAETETPRPAAAAPTGLGSKRRWTSPFRAAAIAAASVVVAVGTGVMPGSTPSAAAQVLLAAAERAAAEDTPAATGVHYSRSENAVLQEGPGGTHGRYSVLLNRVHEHWIALDGSGRVRQTVGEHTFPSDADRERWELAGRPQLNIWNNDRSYGPGEMPDYELAKLSTDGGALRKELLRRYGNDRGEQVSLFVAIGDLLRGTSASPALRSALYRLAADISGVDLLGSTTDHRGRPGVAVAMTSDYGGVKTRNTMIFDPDDGTLLEEQELILERVRWSPTPPPLLSSVATHVESTTVDTVPPPPTVDQAEVATFLDRCAGTDPPGDPADDYLGLSLNDLRKKLRADGLTHRVLGRDGQCLPRTDDLQPNRLNVLVVFGRVVWARRF